MFSRIKRFLIVIELEFHQDFFQSFARYRPPLGASFTISLPVLNSLLQAMQYSSFPSCQVMRAPAPHRGQ